jgi:hypothetical protein
MLMEHGLIIEQIDVRQTAALEEAKNAFGFGRKVRQLRRARDHGVFRRAHEPRKQKRAQRNRADATANVAEKSPPREMLKAVVEWSHGERFITEKRISDDLVALRVSGGMLDV